MTVRFYKCKAFSHPQENDAFERLCNQAVQDMAESGDVHIIGNLDFGSWQIDTILLKQNSITLIDFKSYSGDIVITKNEVWINNGSIVIKAGNRFVNPFLQVQHYKHKLIELLQELSLVTLEANLGHISGVVIFTEPVTINKTAFPELKKLKWFDATDFEGGLKFLRDMASREIALSTPCLEMIIDGLGAQEVHLSKIESWVPASAIKKAEERGARKREWEVYEEEDIRRMQEWELQNRERIQEDTEEVNRRLEEEFVRLSKGAKIVKLF